MSIASEDMRKPTSEKLVGELGDRSPIDNLAYDLRREGINCVGIPLGGTFGMVQDTITREWVSKLEGAFDAEALDDFNRRLVSYEPDRFCLDLVEAPPAPLPRYDELLRWKMGLVRSPITSGRLSLQAIAQDGRLLRNLIYPRALSTGNYPLGLLAADDLGAIHYADLLLRELVLGNYPRGVRLDSSELVDERSMAVFSAVNCGVVFPRIIEAVIRLTGGIRSTERGILREDLDKVIQALPQLIAVITMGSDQKKIANSFYDILCYLTGLTIVVASSNSSYGIEGGDAEANLSDLSRVVRTIQEGRLPRGVAYDVGDGLVSTNLAEKIKPEASTLQTPVLAQDDKYYGVTFLAYHAKPVSSLGEAGWYFGPSTPQIPDLLWLLAYHRLPTDDEESFDLNPTGYNAGELVEVFSSIQRVSVDTALDRLPQGTRFIIIEGPGRGNGPSHALRTILMSTNQIEARTNDAVRPIFIVTSECPFPFATEEYGTSILGNLRRTPGYEDRIVNGKSLSSFAVRNLLALQLFKISMLTHAGYLDKENLLGITASTIQGWIDDYIKARNLPDGNGE